MPHIKGTRRKKLKKRLSELYHSNYVRFGVFLPLFYLFVVYAAYHYEKSISIDSIGDSYWYFLFALVTGIIRFSPETASGRAISLLVVIVRLAFFGTILGKISSAVNASQDQKNKGLLKLKNLTKHFILCGWKPDMEKIISVILSNNPDLTPDQIVLINEAPPEAVAQLRSVAQLKELNYISGDYSNEEILKKALVKTAERVLVLSDSSKSSTQLETDSRTVLAVLAIKNMNPRAYVAAEIYDAKFESHLNLAHCDEIILTTEYEYNLLATASSGQGFSNIIRTLIGTDSSVGVSVEAIPHHFIGKTYGEFAAEQTASKEGESQKSMLIGLLLNTGNFQRRRLDAIREAHKNPNVETVIDNLVKVKSLKSNDPVLLPDDDMILKNGMKAIFIKIKVEVEDEDGNS